MEAMTISTSLRLPLKVDTMEPLVKRGNGSSKQSSIQKLQYQEPTKSSRQITKIPPSMKKLWVCVDKNRLQRTNWHETKLLQALKKQWLMKLEWGLTIKPTYQMRCKLPSTSAKTRHLRSCLTRNHITVLSVQVVWRSFTTPTMHL